MDWSKLKNIIILILLLVNGFLLVLVVGQSIQVDRYQRSALTQAGEILAQNGISVDDTLLRQVQGLSLSPLSVRRNLQRELELARLLLGEDTVRTDQGGGLYGYDSGRGSALFRPNGDLSVTFSVPEGGGEDPARHAAALLDTLGLEAELIQQQALAGDSQALTFRQLVNGVPVYSCQLVFAYEDGQLRTIQGAALTGDIQPAQSAGDIQDLPTALIRFLSGVLTSGDVCSAIEDLQLGYRGSQTFGEESVLSPVWLISTNISDYYLDAATGELTRTAG